MSVTFTLRQVSTIVDGPLYRVKNEVTAAVDASPAVFVYKTVSQVFSHIAMAADMEQFSDSYDTAFQNDQTFYRQTSVTRDWSTVSFAEADVTVVQNRLQLLANDLNRLQGTFVHDDTVVITGV